MQGQGKFGCFTSRYAARDIAGKNGDIHKKRGFAIAYGSAGRKGERE